MPPETPPPSTYREIAPTGPLSRHLVCLWTAQVGAAGVEQPVLPDACVDVLWVGEGDPVVAGPATRAATATVPAGTRVVGARFRPGWAAPALGVSAAELLDRHVPLRDVCAALARRASTAVADAGPLAARLERAAGILARHLADAPPADAVGRDAVRWIAAHPQARVRELGRALHVSPRQLQRRVAEAVGYPPKTLHRILRFQRLLALAGAADGASLAALAQRAGYADQAHMARDVRDLAGRTPTELLARAGSALELADLFDLA
jgi:AraC-like DNA-binding protein